MKRKLLVALLALIVCLTFALVSCDSGNDKDKDDDDETEKNVATSDSSSGGVTDSSDTTETGDTTESSDTTDSSDTTESGDAIESSDTTESSFTTESSDTPNSSDTTESSNDTTDSSEFPTFFASKTKAVAGDQNVAVTISLKNNPGVASIILTLTYDNTYLDLTKIEYNSKIDGQTVYPQELQSPATLYWINGFADTTGDWILATLYFNVSEDAMGENDIQISYNPDNVYNIAEENLDFEVIHGKIIIE